MGAIIFDLTFSHFLRVLFYMVLIWKDQGTKTNAKVMAVLPSASPLRSLMKKMMLTLIIIMKRVCIPCSWAKFGQNLQLSIQNVQLGDADHKSGWYGTSG